MTTALGFSVLFPWEILQYLKQSSYRKYQGEHIYYSWGCIDLHSQHDSKRIFTTSEKTPFSLSLSLSLSLSFPVWLFLLILLSCLTLGHTKIWFKVELKQTHRNTDMASVWNGFYGFRIIRTGWIWKQPAQWWQNKVKCSKTSRGPMASETWNNV